MRKLITITLLLVLCVTARGQSASQKPDGPIRVSTEDGSVSFEGIREFQFPANQVRVVGRKAIVFTKYGLASSDIPNLDASKVTTGLFGRARLCTGTADATVFCRGDGAWASAESPLTFSAPLSRAGNTVSIPKADATHDGYLSLGDWATFNGKQAALGFTPLSPANNLSELSSAVTARTNLGLGTAATQSSAAFAAASHAHAAGDITSGALAVARTPVLDGVFAYNSANQSIADATLTAVTFNSEASQDGSSHSTSTNPSRFAAQTAGKYGFTCSVYFAGSGAGMRQLAIVLNGATATYLAIDQQDGSASGNGLSASVTGFKLAAGDYLECYVYQTSGGALNVVATNGRLPSAGFQFVSS